MEILAVLLIAAVAALLGVWLGMLAAPRIERWAERDAERHAERDSEEPDDGSERDSGEGSGGITGET